MLLGPPLQKREFLILWTFICGVSIRRSHRDTTLVGEVRGYLSDRILSVLEVLKALNSLSATF